MIPRTAAIEAAARDAWEHDHPGIPWDMAPESVLAAMRGMVAPVVDSVLRLAVEPDTFPDGTPFDWAVSRAQHIATTLDTPVRFVLKGIPLVGLPGHTWQDTATRYHEAANDPEHQ